MDFQSNQFQGEQRHAHSANRGTAFPSNTFHFSQSEFEHEEKKINRYIDGFITFCIGALFLGLPLFFTGLAYQGISFEKQMYFYFWILLSLVGWASKSVISGEMHLKKTPLDIPIMLFLLGYIVSAIASIDRWHSFWGYFGDPSRGILNVLSVIVAYYIIINHFSLRRLFIWICALSFANIIFSIWTLVQILGIKIPEVIAQYAPISTVGSLTGIGILLGASLPILMMLVFKVWEIAEKNIFTLLARVVLLISIVLNLFLLLALYNFVSWFGVLLGVSFFLVYVLAQIVRPKKGILWMPMFVFVAILVILMVGQNSIARVQLPVEISPSYAMSWQIAKESLKKSFLVGSGPATYWYDFSLYKPQEFNMNPYYNLRFFQGSGLFFEFLSTVGAVGTILLLLITLTYISVGVYLLSIDKKQNKITSLGLYASSLVILVNAFAGKIEGVVIVIGVMVAALTLGVLHYESNTQDRRFTLSLKSSPKYALSLAFLFMVISAGVVFLFVFIGKVYLADVAVGRGVRLMNTNIDEAMKKTTQAIQWNQKESRYFILYSQQALTAANAEALKGEKDRSIGTIQQYLNDSIFAASQAKEISKNDVTAVEAAAQVYENSTLYAQDSASFAHDYYKRALELEPENAVFFLKLGKLKLTEASTSKDKDAIKKLLEEAQEFFNKAIEKKKDLADAYDQLAIAKELLGDLDGAIANAEQALLIDRGNSGYAFSLARMYQSRGKEDDLKASEFLYKEILSRNDKEINTIFGLGSLYEKQKKKSEAIAEYKRVLNLLPEDNDKVKSQIEKMISNVEKGIENTAQNIIDGTEEQNASVIEQTTQPLPEALP